MSPFIKRNLLVTVSVILFAGLLCSFSQLIPVLRNYVQHMEFIIIGLMIMMGLVVMLFWSTLGVFGGLTSFLLAMIFLHKPFMGLNPYYYGVLIMAFFLSGYIGYFVARKISVSSQKYTITMEKVQENTNLIGEHIQSREAEVSAMGEKISSLLKLKGIANRLGLSLSAEEIIKTVSEETFQLFGGDTRVLFFMVDGTGHKELTLFHTAKGEGRSAFASKNGGIFDKWALKNMKSLLVKDVKKDFRFSLQEGEKKDDTVSLIINPLMMENSVLGVLRVDSPNESQFSQYELRILDIVGDLTAVALENARLYSQTEELAITDSLTGLYVHRYFMERLEEEIKRGLRSDSSFALLMFDIDNFKDFNDRHGHVFGDTVLKNIARVLRSKASAGDIVARYGGEEFTFLSLNCDRKQAVRLAEDLRKEIQKSMVTMRREEYSVTISAGVAMFPEDAKIKEDLIWEADKYLYKAKAEGKNKVCSK